MTQNLKLVVFLVFFSFIGISLGGWQDKILTQNTRAQNTQTQNTQSPKLPKAKIPKY